MGTNAFLDINQFDFIKTAVAPYPNRLAGHFHFTNSRVLFLHQITSDTLDDQQREAVVPSREHAMMREAE